MYVSSTKIWVSPKLGIPHFLLESQAPPTFPPSFLVPCADVACPKKHPPSLARVRFGGVCRWHVASNIESPNTASSITSSVSPPLFVTPGQPLCLNPAPLWKTYIPQHGGHISHNQNIQNVSLCIPPTEYSLKCATYLLRVCPNLPPHIL